MANEENSVELPYLEKVVTYTVRLYNPKYGDGRICICGHPYHRHFDGFLEEDDADVGCKYCPCIDFVESTNASGTN